MTATVLSGGGGYGPVFYRTAADRRPATVVVRPNDGPGDWSKRRALARQARERAEAKTIKINRPKTAKELIEERRELAQKVILQALVEREGGLALSSIYTLSDLPDMTGNVIETQVLCLFANGYVEKERIASRGGGSYVVVTITDAGREYLEDVA